MRHSRCLFGLNLAHTELKNKFWDIYYILILAMYLTKFPWVVSAILDIFCKLQQLRWQNFECFSQFLGSVKSCHILSKINNFSYSIVNYLIKFVNKIFMSMLKKILIIVILFLTFCFFGYRNYFRMADMFDSNVNWNR